MGQQTGKETKQLNGLQVQKEILEEWVWMCAP